VNDLLTTIVGRNEEFRHGWKDFENHRIRVTGLLASCFESPQPTIALWGAGNCNDVDLSVIGRHYQAIHLVDVDRRAVDSAVHDQQEMARRITIHAPMDLSGILEQLGGLRVNQGGPRFDDEVNSIIEAAGSSTPAGLHGQVDVAASMCLLTQIVDGLRMSVGENHRSFVELVAVVRRRHLQLLLESVRQGGVAFLFSDVVSSETAPEIPTTPEEQFGDYLIGLIRNNNFFTGANPFAILKLLQTDTQLNCLVDQVQLIQPWKWNLGPRWYAVTAI